MAQPQKINGSNVLGLFRLEKNAATEKAAIINYQTSLDFEFKRAVSYTHLTLPTTERV